MGECRRNSEFSFESRSEDPRIGASVRSFRQIYSEELARKGHSDPIVGFELIQFEVSESLE